MPLVDEEHLSFILYYNMQWVWTQNTVRTLAGSRGLFLGL